MSDERNCPKCGIEWPNFCPLDGQRLSGPWTCSNAPQRVAPAPAEPAPAAAAPPGLDTPWAARKAKKKRRQDLDSARTVVDARAVDVSQVLERLGGAAPATAAPAPTTPAAPPAASGPKDQDAVRLATTVIHRQLTPEQVAEAQRKAAAAATPSVPKKRKKDEFSDTQWFMRGPRLEDADPETGVVPVDEEAYLLDESIPEEERRKFTLRKRGEE